MRTLLWLGVLCLASSSLCSEGGHPAAPAAGAHAAAAAEGHRDDKSLSATPSQQENVNINNPDICLRFSSTHTSCQYQESSLRIENWLNISWPPCWNVSQATIKETSQVFSKYFYYF